MFCPHQNHSHAVQHSIWDQARSSQHIRDQLSLMYTEAMVAEAFIDPLRTKYVEYSYDLIWLLAISHLHVMCEGGSLSGSLPPPCMQCRL